MLRLRCALFVLLFSLRFVSSSARLVLVSSFFRIVSPSFPVAFAVDADEMVE